MKYALGEQVEYSTRFRKWSGVWVPAKVVELHQVLDEQGPWNTMVIELYNLLRYTLTETEQKLCLRPVKSHWDSKLKEWVRSA